VINFGLLAT